MEWCGDGWREACSAWRAGLLTQPQWLDVAGVVLHRSGECLAAALIAQRGIGDLQAQRKDRQRCQLKRREARLVRIDTITQQQLTARDLTQQKLCLGGIRNQPNDRAQRRQHFADPG